MLLFWGLGAVRFGEDPVAFVVEKNIVTFVIGGNMVAFAIGREKELSDLSGYPVSFAIGGNIVAFVDWRNVCYWREISVFFLVRKQRLIFSRLLVDAK